MNTDEFTEALDDAGYDWREYSGRAMFGANCVGIDLESDGELWGLATQLAIAGVFVDAPRTDSMGLGIIAYWPSFKTGGAA